MKLNQAHQRIAIGAALVFAALMTAVSGNDVPVPDVSRRVPTTSVDPQKPPAGAPVAVITLDQLKRTPSTEDGIDLFAARSWTPPPPVVQAKPTPPPKPTAPTLPFSYVGQMEGKDGLLVYLSRSGELVPAKQGDQLGADYKLESVTPDLLTFVYIPLGEKQTLATGGK